MKRIVNFRLTEEEKRFIEKVGEGNKAKGLRKMMKLVKTMGMRGFRKVTK